jgi:hypothetical protein
LIPAAKEYTRAVIVNWEQGQKHRSSTISKVDTVRRGIADSTPGIARGVIAKTLVDVDSI